MRLLTFCSFFLRKLIKCREGGDDIKSILRLFCILGDSITLAIDLRLLGDRNCRCNPGRFNILGGDCISLIIQQIISQI